MNYKVVNFNRRSNLVDYITSLDENITKISDTEASVYGKFSLSMNWVDNNKLSVTITSNDIRLFSTTNLFDYGNEPVVHLEIYINDHFTYLSINRNTYNDRFIRMVFLNTKGNGFAGLSSGAFYDIPCKSSDLPDDLHYFTKIMPFIAPTGYIAFAEGAPITNKSSSTFWVDGVVSCSNVVKGSIITISGHNYLALDTNTLVQLPDD